MINLFNLYLYQMELDKEIADKHNITYEETRNKRILALIVELGELANETRCFKFWSFKGPSPKEVIMDEFADGLHFLLSLGIILKVSKMEYEIKKEDLPLDEQFHQVYRAASELHDSFDESHYVSCFQKFLNLAPSLGMDEKDIVDSYLKKLSVNHKRQEQNY